MMPMPDRSSSGPRLAALVLLAVLVVGMVWLLGRGGDEAGSEPGPAPVAGAHDGGADEEQSTVASLESDAGGERREIEARGAAGETSAALDLEAPIEEPIEEPVEAESVLWIVGRVVDARGQGVAHARVRWRAGQAEPSPAILGLRDLDEFDTGGDGAVVTEPDGSFELGAPDPGAFRLLVTHAEHPKSDTRHAVDPAQDRVEGIVVTLRDGATITGQIVGGPDDVEPLLVCARRVDSSPAGALAPIDFSTVLDGLGVPLGSRTAVVDQDRRFEVRGLDPDASYEVWGLRGEAVLTRPCTARQNVRAGATGVELVWREGLVVTFRVLDASTGAPLDDLRVAAGLVRYISMLGMQVPVPMARPYPDLETPEGRVRITGLEAGNQDKPVVVAEVRADGYRTWRREDIAVPQSGVFDLGDVRLEPTSVIAVRVIDAETGAPVAGVAVALAAAEPDAAPDEAREGSRSISIGATADVSGGPAISVDHGAPEVRTDAEGRCEITCDLEGRARLVADAEGYATLATEEFEVPRIPQRLERELAVGRGGTVVVTVVDSAGRLVENPHVKHRSPIGDAEESQQVFGAEPLRFEQLAAGRHEFSIVEASAGQPAAGGMRMRISGLDDGSDPPVVVEVPAIHGHEQQIELVQPLRCTLSGTVTLDGAPLDRADLQVTAVQDGMNAMESSLRSAMQASIGGMFGLGGATDDSRTGEDGRFKLERVKVGERVLVVTHSSLLMPVHVPVHLVEGENVQQVALRLTRLEGRVLGPDGAPLAGANVSVSPDAGREGARLANAAAEAEEVVSSLLPAVQVRRSVRTDAEGRFVLPGVRSGIGLAVRVEARQHITETVAVPALAEGAHETGLEVRLAAAGRVRIRVHGETETGAHVRAVWAGDDVDPPPAGGTKLLRNGRALLDGLRPGRWALECSKAPGGREETRTVEVQAGETVRVEF